MALNDWNDQSEKELVRIRVVIVMMVAALVFLTGFLWRVQVVRGEAYAESGEYQSIRRVILPGIRGRIFDRNGVCLADNRPSYSIAIHVRELRQSSEKKTLNKVEEVIDRLSGILGLERQVTREQTQTHLRIRRPLPFVVWRDIEQEALARWMESDAAMPGSDSYISAVEVMVSPVRVYPIGKTAAHVLGYVRQVKPDVDDMTARDFYVPQMKGVQGVECSMDEVLAGESGWRWITVDAAGFRHKHQGDREEPRRAGYDVRLTLDYRIQREAEKALEGKRGAVVVMDPRNGDVLAMASEPSYDPNTFTPRIRREDWNRLRSDKRRPLMNRAIAGTYSPGSTFKPVVAIAALVKGKATANTTFNCSGVYRVGTVPFKCWNKRGHGTIAMVKAIEQSCNCYFYQLAIRCGYDHTIYPVAHALGLGMRTDIELPGERSGLLPNNAWKMRTMNDKWRTGDTCNLAIGQGALLVTPLQMASVVCAIANGGSVYRPRLVYSDEMLDVSKVAIMAREHGGFMMGELVVRMQWPRSAVETVRQGMRDVVQAPHGTGKRAKVDGVTMGGKTGTAQYGPVGKNKHHTWMLFFAPYDSPRYAGVVLVEDGESGGRTAAPIVHSIVETIFSMEGSRDNGGT